MFKNTLKPLNLAKAVYSVAMVAVFFLVSLATAHAAVMKASKATAPIANFTATPASGTAPLLVTFTDSSTGSITSRTWDFGDGTTSNAQTVVKTYNNLGTFAAKLTVAGMGRSSTATKTISTTATTPVASFSATPVSGAAPLAATFTNTSTGTVTEYIWDFGDGATTSTQTKTNPVHTYASPGTYTVKLTVVGPAGTDTRIQASYITVTTACRRIWLCPAELNGLPTSGAAWDRLYQEANTSIGTPNLANQDDLADMRVLARALVVGRTGNPAMREEVIQACLAVIGTEQNGSVLALARNLLPYVVAADLVGLPPEAEASFTAWLQGIVDLPLLPDNATLRSINERRPNNWGTHAGASRLAVALYLGNQPEVERVAQVFKGYLGDRGAYASFSYGALDWQADPAHPVGINPPGATRDGHSLDGVLPDDQRRCCTGFTWPPPQENYVYEGLQGAIAQAVMLHRAGFDVWNWESQALLRAYRWLHTEASYPASGDDTWQPHLVNYYYNSSFPAPIPSRPGKNMGFTDWTHGPGAMVY